jgi:hypothetical protein
MSLLEILQLIPDKRRKQGQKYDLAHTLFYSILAVLCGANSYAGICTVLKIKLKLLNKVFGTKWKTAPATTTLFYIFNSLDITEFEAAFRLHAEDLVKSTGGLTLAIDGKSLRGTGSKSDLEDDKLQQILSIFETKKNIIIAHFDSIGKGNELKSMQEIMTEVKLPIGSTITTDALHTQKKL